MALVTPEQLAKPHTEHAEQVALFAWAAMSGIPELKWMHAIPNGGERNPIVAGRLKSEGVRSGVHDVFLPVTCGVYAGLYIEMKKPGREREKNGGMSDDQVEFRDFATAHHYKCVLCYSWEQAAAEIKVYIGYGIT